MSPTKSSITKNKPRKTVSKTKKVFKQRKIPGGLVGIPFEHYGVRWTDINNDDDVTTTIPPSAASRSNTSSSSHATTFTQNFVLPSADIVHSRIPVSAPIPKYPDNATQAAMYPNPLTTGFPQFFHQNELPDGLDFHTQMHDTLSMASNPWQSYGQCVANHQLETNGLALPPRSSVNLGYDGDLSLHPNVQHPTMSYATNTPIAYTPAPYDLDMTHYYVETSQSSYLAMMPNGGSVFPFESFLNDDAHARYNPY